MQGDGWSSSRRNTAGLSCDADYDELAVSLPSLIGDRFPSLIAMLEGVRLTGATNWVELEKRRDRHQNAAVERLLDEIWADLEPLVREAALIDGIRWPWLLPSVIVERAPALQAVVQEFVSGDQIRITTVWGNLFLRISGHMKDRCDRSGISLPAPEPQVCCLCSRRFPPELLSPSWTRWFGESFCEVCAQFLFPPSDRSRTGDDSVADLALVTLCELLGGPVGARLQRDVPYRAIDRAKKQAIAAAVACCGSAADYKRRYGGTWPAVLFALGIIKEPLRRGRGTVCQAEDGHLCRSMLERTVDDFFSQAGIPHSPEPPWPHHPVLNASGKRKADWLVSGQLYVEMAGMMSDSDYSAKMAEKVQLAEGLGLPLLVLTPEMLGSLDYLFSDWHPTSG